MAEDELVSRIRAFNRRWTEVLGLLDAHLLETDHTLTESRVLFELGRAGRGGVDRLELRDRLGIDQSFLTRVLAGLQRHGLVAVERDAADGRRRRLALTPAGRSEARRLDRRSSAQVAELVRPLSPDQRRRFGEALTVTAALATPGRPGPVEVAVRGLEPGDLGWVVERHGALYADEYGWDGDFEALVATIVADFHRTSTAAPDRERAWIATVDGARAGCVFCVARDERTAQLRILIVEPWARGLGIGARLVDECVEFARRAGYEQLVLWTNDVLVSARRIYQAAGFALVDEEAHHSFGHDLVGQHWSLDLSPPRVSR